MQLQPLRRIRRQLGELADAVGGATYYVVVDGYGGQASEYNLYVSCTAPDGRLEGHVLDIVSQPPTRLHRCERARRPGGPGLGVDPGTGQ